MSLDQSSKAPGAAININRISGGKSVEHWIEMDTPGLLQQLGVIPAPGPLSTICPLLQADEERDSELLPRSFCL